MTLTADEAKLFYETFYALLRWVNEQKGVVPGLPLRPGDPAGEDPAQVARVRDALWSDSALLDAIVATNPAGLSPDALALAASWRHRRAGTYIVYREFAKYTAVLDDASQTAFAVLGINNPVGDRVPFVPCMAKMVLLPFGDRITYDSLLVAYTVHMGPGIRSRLNAIWRAAKPSIATRLGPAAPGPSTPKKTAKTAARRASPGTANEEKPGKALLHPGRCAGCGGVFSKRAMGNHLAACPEVQGHSRGRPVPVHRLVAESPGAKEFWIYLDVPDGTTLAKIDAALRETWLECCGHLSAFRIAGQSFASSPMDDAHLGMRERKMTAKVEEVISVPRWDYEYDYGSTTALRLRPTATYLGRGGGVRVVARNLQPEWRCELCGAPATKVCAQCSYQGAGWVCDRCAPRHPCGDDQLLPAVNSPRVGVCGYAG